MKISRFFVLVFVLFMAQAPLHAQHRTADSMVHKLFASLQQKDENAFLSLHPNAEQFSQFIKTIMQQVMKSDAMKQIFAMDEKTKNINIDSLITAEVSKAASPKEFEAMQSEIKRSFQKAIEKGEAKGVKWSEARLTGFTIDSATVANEKAEQFNLSGLKEAKGVIGFSVGDSSYQMSFGKMMFFPDQGGWFGVNVAQVARKGDSLAPDASDKGMATDTESAEATNMAPLPPAKKPVTKSKQKPTVRKPKS
jgi:hypothetical protein